jgi:hypothetical protein
VRSGPAPGTGDRKGQSRALDVDEEGRTVRAEAGAGKLTVVHPILGEPFDDPVPVHACHPVAGIPVLAEEEVSVGRDGQVVGVVDEALVVRFDEECQSAGLVVLSGGALEGAGHVAEDLPELGVAARGAHEVHGAVTHPDALASCEASRTRLVGSVPEIVIR